MIILGVAIGCATFSFLTFWIVKVSAYVIERVQVAGWMAYAVGFMVPAWVGALVGSIALGAYVAGLR